MKHIVYFFLLAITFQCSNPSAKGETKIDLTDDSEEATETAVIQTIKEKPKKRTFVYKSFTCVKELIDACTKNDLEKATFLINSGCDVNGTVEIGYNAWMSPLRAGVHHDDTKIAKLLLDAGADPELDLGRLVKPINYGAGYNPETLKLLIANGGNVNSFNEGANYQTPLIWAINRGKIENVKILVQNGALIDYDTITYEYIQSPLHRAIKDREYEIAKYLLEQGANPNFKITEVHEDCYVCPWDIAPIHEIGLIEDLETAKQFTDLFIEFQADLNITNGYDENVIGHIAPGGNANLAEYLIEKGVVITDAAVARAAMFQNEKFLEVLLINGGNPNAYLDRESALSHAITCCGDGFNERSQAKRIKTIDLLLRNGAKPDSILINLVNKDERFEDVAKLLSQYEN
ncbi:ankyrin repeat domain-containing protein [Ekhidna sp.]|uniref:ankyrin repeat domain-containing protein n=1 Tax=Ekhidna sp. TaxID=2608089 RepID=UPI003B5C7E4C